MVVVDGGIGVVFCWRESNAMISPLVVPRGKVGGRFVVGVPRNALPSDKWPPRGALVVPFDRARFLFCLVLVTAARRLERSCSMELEL